MYDAALAPAKLRSTQFSVLVEIQRRGDEPPMIGELAEALVMDASTIGQNLRPLEREGLLALRTSEVDRRRRCVVLTRKGAARLADALPLWEEAQGRFERKFGKRAAAQLRAALSSIARERSFVG
jgi:DNA-binding MarR family transcriptional regulator